MPAVIQTVVSALQAVFENKGLSAPALGRETKLDASLGLESLDFAELVIRLEQATGKDPFSTGEVVSVRTLGDLVDLYY